MFLGSASVAWLHIQRSGFDSLRYQIFWDVVDLERGPLSLVSTTEELLGRKSSGSGLASREYGCRDPSLWPRSTPYLQMLAPCSLTSGGRLVGIVRSRTQATEFSLVAGVVVVALMSSGTLGETLTMMARLRVEMWTQDLQNTWQESNHSTASLGF
jgi:hypothetical protein